MSALIFTEPKYISNLVKFESTKQWGWCRKVVTVNVASATDLTIGSVLGVVTSTGSYKPRDPDATTGEQVAAAVVIENVSVELSTDTDVLVLVRGDAILAEEALVFDVTHDETQTATAIAELEALDFSFRTQLHD